MQHVQETHDQERCTLPATGKKGDTLPVYPGQCNKKIGVASASDSSKKKPSEVIIHACLLLHFLLYIFFREKHSKIKKFS